MKLIDLLSTCRGSFVVILNGRGNVIAKYTGTGLMRLDGRDESIHDCQVTEVRVGFGTFEGKLVVTIA
jgi:hypothetical protein